MTPYPLPQPALAHLVSPPTPPVSPLAIARRPASQLANDVSSIRQHLSHLQIFSLSSCREVRARPRTAPTTCMQPRRPPSSTSASGTVASSRGQSPGSPTVWPQPRETRRHSRSYPAASCAFASSTVRPRTTRHDLVLQHDHAVRAVRGLFGRHPRLRQKMLFRGSERDPAVLHHGVDFPNVGRC